MGKKKKREPSPPPPPRVPPVKKMTKGTVFTTSVKVIIMNVYKYFRREYPEINVSEAARRTSAATGCGLTSVYLLRKEESSPQGLREPKKKVRTRPPKNSRENKYGENIRLVIRNIVYDLKARNLTPSLKTILGQCRMHTDMPVFSILTLRRLLFEMGFMYKKDGKKHILVEKVIEVEPNKPVKKPKVPKGPKVPKVPRKKVPKPEKAIQSNPDFDVNMFDSLQYMHKTEYMFFDNKQNNMVQPQQQQQQQQPPNIPTQVAQVSQLTNAPTATLIRQQMPPPILPTSIHHRDMQMPNTSPKLMMLSTAQSSTPWN